MSSGLPHLRPDIQIRRLADGNYYLEAEGARGTRISERVARALGGLKNADSLEGWAATCGIAVPQLMSLLGRLHERALIVVPPPDNTEDIAEGFETGEPTQLNKQNPFAEYKHVQAEAEFVVHSAEQPAPGFGDGPPSVIVSDLPMTEAPANSLSGIDVDMEFDEPDIEVMAEQGSLEDTAPPTPLSVAALPQAVEYEQAQAQQAQQTQQAQQEEPEEEELAYAGDDEADVSDRSAVWDEAEQSVEGESSSRKRRRRRKLSVAARLMAVPALIVGASFLIPYDLNITSRCTLRPLKSDTVRAPRAGVIDRVEVEESERVPEGHILGQLANADFRTALIKSESRLAKANAELELLKAGNRPEEVERARAQVNGLYREVQVAKRSVARLKRLVRQGVAPRAQLEVAQQRMAGLQGQLSQSNAEYKLAQAGTRPDELKKKEAELRGLEAQLKLDREIVESTVLRTRMAGVVTTRRPKDLLRTRVEAGDPIFEVATLERMRAEVFVSERDFDSLKAGLPVGLKVASYPRRLFAGTVLRIAPKIEVIDGQNVVRVEAEIENADGLLVPNMTGFAEINAGTRPVAMLVVRRLLRWVRVRFLV